MPPPNQNLLTQATCSSSQVCAARQHCWTLRRQQALRGHLTEQCGQPPSVHAQDTPYTCVWQHDAHSTHTPNSHQSHRYTLSAWSEHRKGPLQRDSGTCDGTEQSRAAGCSRNSSSQQVWLADRCLQPASTHQSQEQAAVPSAGMRVHCLKTMPGVERSSPTAQRCRPIWPLRPPGWQPCTRRPLLSLLYADTPDMPTPSRLPPHPPRPSRLIPRAPRPASPHHRPRLPTCSTCAPAG